MDRGYRERVDPSQPRNIWGSIEGKNARFTRISKELTRSTAFQHLQSAAKSLLLCAIEKCFASTMNGIRGSTFRFSPKDAALWGISESTFYRHIKTLCEYGFLDPVEKGGGKKKNVYAPSDKWRSFTPTMKKKGQRKYAPNHPCQSDRCIPPNLPEENRHSDRGQSDVVSLSSDICGEDIPSLTLQVGSRADFESLSRKILDLLGFELEQDRVPEFADTLKKSGASNIELIEMARLARDQYPADESRDRLHLFLRMVDKITKRRADSPISALVASAVEFVRGEPTFIEHLSKVALNFAKSQPGPLSAMTLLSALGKVDHEHLSEEDAVALVVERMESIQSTPHDIEVDIFGVEPQYANN